MQDVTSLTHGALSTPPSALHLSSSASGSTRQADSLGLKSSVFGGKLVVQQSSAPRRMGSNDDGAGTAFQVRATTSPKKSFSLKSIIEGVIKHPGKDEPTVEYKGAALIGKKRASVGNLLIGDIVDPVAKAEDDGLELVGQKIDITLVSVDLDPETKTPKLSPTSSVDGWLTNPGDLDLVADNDYYSINFKVPEDFGVPGAFIIKNHHRNEFFLKSLVLTAPDQSTIEFLPLAWVHRHDRYPKDRVFFSTKTYLPSATPSGLQALREQELEQTRGDGTGRREPWDRIYDYAFYNDLGEPDLEPALIRPVLGGSQDLPYPRRIRTGRPMSKKDPKSESRLSGSDIADIPYIPSDEFFLRTKNSTFIASFIKGIAHFVTPALSDKLGTKTSFKSFKAVSDLYKDGLPLRLPTSVFNLPSTPEVDAQTGSLVYLSTIFAPKGSDVSVVNYPVPQVFKTDEKAWKTDEEYGREALAGIHAGVVQIVTAYPPKSTLDVAEYGQGTSLTDKHILPYLEGLSVAKAIEGNKLYTIDHHDAFLPFINRANADTKAGFKCYAPRTIFFLSSSGQLKPVAIELSIPPAQKGGSATNRVFTPADTDHLWELAKIHATSIDFNFHEVLSHFTYTHGVMEPFIIASNRQLSKLHPIRTLLQPHFKDTMNINAGAREALINAAGIIEQTFSMGQYAFTLGAKGYGALWQFDKQGIPQNLLARGMAKPADASYPGSVKLVVDDYPWAKDGLELWDALNKWVAKYVDIVYKGSDETVKADTELQAWWHEIVNVGHGDLKDAAWWPKLDSVKNLVFIVTTIAWIAGPMHAGVNFGQYAYGGYPLNKPSGTRRFIPEKGSADYSELQKDPDTFILSTITSSFQATLVMTVLELLVTHSVDEEYFGTVSMYTDWRDPQVSAAFQEFSQRITTLAEDIKKRNNDQTLINRSGPAKVPYTLFYPTSSSGLTGQGVPYSVSI